MKASVVLIAVLWSSVAAAEEKIALPPLEELKAAAKQIHKQYEEEFAKTGTDEKLALAAKLLKRAETANEKAADRYVLYCEAMTLAAKAGAHGEGKHVYVSALSERGKTFAALEIGPDDHTVTIEVTKDNLLRYDGTDYEKVDKLVEALVKNVDCLDPIVLLLPDKNSNRKAAAQFFRAAVEAGFTRILFKVGNGKTVPIDEMGARAGVLERAVEEGIALIAENKIAESMNEIRAGINCFQYDKTLVTEFCLRSLDDKMAQETDAKKKAALLVYRAVLLLSDVKHPGNAEKAVEALNDAEAADATLPEIFNTRGIAWNYLKQPDKAQADFEKALALKADYPDAIENRNRVNTALGKIEAPLSEKEEFGRERKRLDAKIAELSEAVRLRPEFFRFWMMRSGFLHQRGRLEEALADLDSADKLSPNSLDVLTGRGSAYFQMGKVDLALENAKLALEQKPDSEHAACLCGMSYCESGELDKALKSFALALAPGGRHPEIVLTDRAFVHFYKGEFNRAIEDCSAAFQKNASYFSALHLRARIYLLQGKADEARADFQTIVNATARSNHEWTVKAMARAATGDFDGALRICDLVRELRPADRWLDFSVAAIYCIRAASPDCKTKENDISEAIRLLNDAAKHGMKNWAQVQAFPEMKILLNDARFQELTKKP